jgi:hypothetical protein
MIRGSHMLEPPPRSEDFWIEWKCQKCGLFGKSSVAHSEPAREVFANMLRNHDNQSRPRTPNGEPDKNQDPACQYPTFQWARITPQ